MNPRNHLKVLLAILFLPACAGENAEWTDEGVSAITQRCASAADCAELACVEGGCSPCTEHAHCASDVCDVYQVMDHGPGRCVPEENVVYVGRADADLESCERATGVRRDPFCQIQDALSVLGAGRTVIRVAPGYYWPFHVDGGVAFTLYGPAGEGGSAHVTEEEVGGVSVRGGARVLLDGVELGRYSHGAGLRCEDPGTRIVVRRSLIYTDPRWALQSNGCELQIEDTEVLPRD